MWPTFEDPVSGRQGKGKRNGKGRVEESGVYMRPMSAEEKESRKRIAMEWKAREERPVEGRRRVQGAYGYKSMIEAEKLMGTSEWGFRPTLGGVVEDAIGKSQEETGKLTRDREERGGNGQRDRKTSTSGKEKKSRRSSGALMTESVTREIRNWAGRDDRRHGASTIGKEQKVEESSGGAEDDQGHSQSRSRYRDVSGVGSSKILKPRATYRPWAKGCEGGDDFSDALPSDPRLRKEKRVRFSSNDSLD